MNLREQTREGKFAISLEVKERLINDGACNPRRQRIMRCVLLCDITDAHLSRYYVIIREMTDIIDANRNMIIIIQDCMQAVDPTGARPIYLSFDIDAIDPRLAPSTGTQRRDGGGLA